MSAAEWRFDYRVMAELPPLAWVAEVSAPRISVGCGVSVRCARSGFLEGTWSGNEDIGGLGHVANVFGPGMAVHGGDLLIVPPSHTHEGVFATRIGATTVVSNSIVALLAATGGKLDPGVAYPTILCQVAADDGVGDRAVRGRGGRSYRLCAPAADRTRVARADSSGLRAPCPAARTFDRAGAPARGHL